MKIFENNNVERMTFKNKSDIAESKPYLNDG